MKNKIAILFLIGVLLVVLLSFGATTAFGHEEECTVADIDVNHAVCEVLEPLDGIIPEL